MELDELKDSWNHTDKNFKPQNEDIMELIKHKSYGPVAALKREYKKQMRLPLLMPMIILATNISQIDKTLTSVMFWSYIVFCVSVVIYAWYNYRLVGEIEVMDGVVKSTLEKQVAILDTRLKWNIVGLRIVLIFFIVLTEVLPYLQHYSMLDRWHSLSPFIRYSVYAAFLFMQYFISGPLLQRKFGKHIAYLKQMSGEMQ
jgi:hypothetical protein